MTAIKKISPKKKVEVEAKKSSTKEVEGWVLLEILEAEKVLKDMQEKFEVTNQKREE